MRDAIRRRRVQLWQALSKLGGWDADVVVTPPTWRVRFVRWFVAVVVLCIAYQVYALLMVPIIEPSPGTASDGELVESPVTVDAHPELAELFPEDAWERGQPMVLATQWGRLLFREYHTGDNGRLELTPCTIVFYAPSRGAGRSGSPRPIVLQTPDKAVLSFSGPLNLARAEFAKLQGARLEGEVRIWSRESRPGAQDALSIVTRNVQILPRQIWTAHDVSLTYGASRGTGRDLSITLSPAGEADATRTNGTLIKNLESLELAHLEQLFVQVPTQGLLGELLPASAAAGQQPAGGPERPAEVEAKVTCQGPFRFNFQQSVASLEDHVEIVRDNGSAPSDQLSCERLLIHFESVAGQAAAAPDPPLPDADRSAPSDDSAAPRLAVRRIEAHGLPATLRLPSMLALASGQYLSYDFQTRRVLIVDEQNASLAYGEHQAEAPRLEYELPPDLKRLGHLWATGPGIYQGQIGDDPERRLTARWSGVLELQPQEGLHVLSIVQGADIRWNNVGSFAADELYLWLAEVEAPEPVADPAQRPAMASPASESVAAAPPAAAADIRLLAAQSAPEPLQREVLPPAPPRTRWQIRPVKMLAQGHVQTDSPQFQGQTPRLEIWFDHPDPAGPQASEARPADPALSSDAAHGTPDVAPPAAQATSERKVELAGDWIRLRLRIAPARPQVNEATVVGNVRLSQLPSAPQDQPMLVTGEMLQLRTDRADRSAVDVNGSPARVHVQGLLLEGSSLHVSQRENRLWAEGPGRMRLPTQGKLSPAGAAAMPADPPAAPDGPSAPLWISWEGGMDFDGQLVRFVRQVAVRGVYTNRQGDRQHLVSAGNQLHAALNRYVSFDKMKGSAQLDVAELRFLGDVLTDNQTFSVEDVLTSHDQIKMCDMTLDRRTGRFHAAGPGWIISTRVATGGLANSVPGAAAARRGNDAWTEPRANRLIYVRVDYQNEIEGNIDQREAVLQHYVQAVYGPVASWDQTLDPNQQGGLGPQGIVMTCQRLFLAETGQGAQRGIELSAVGDTLVEGATFTARAQRFSYVQAKDLLVVDGENQPAQIRLQGRPGDRPSEFSARQFKYWVSTGQHEEIGVTQLDFNQVGSPNLPSARIR